MAFGHYDPTIHFLKPTSFRSGKAAKPARGFAAKQNDKWIPKGRAGQSDDLHSRGSTKMPRKRLNKVSSRRQKEGKEYAKLRKIFLAQNPICQIQWDDDCSNVVTQVHHVKFRGKHYLDVRYWKSGCAHCHRMVTDNGREAERRGHVIREYAKHQSR